MEQATWRVRSIGLPTLNRYCKKCKQVAEFECSEMFRVNAQRKMLDVWLIYKCIECGCTWNAPILSRVRVSAAQDDDLAGYTENSPDLVANHAFDFQLLKRLGAEVNLPPYVIDGEALPPGENVLLLIENPLNLPLRIESVIRKGLGCSKRHFLNLMERKVVSCRDGIDLTKAKVGASIELVVLRQQGL